MLWGDDQRRLRKKLYQFKFRSEKGNLANLFANYSAEKWRKCDDNNIEDKEYKVVINISFSYCYYFYSF